MRADGHQVFFRVAGILISVVLTDSARGEVLNEAAKLLAGDGTQFDSLGISVSISGDVSLVGASSDDDSGFDSGSAYIFRRTPGSPSSWMQEAKLLPSDGAQFDEFGISVSVSGDVAVVGAHGDDDRGNGSGSVYIFRRSGRVWIQEQKLLASDGASGDEFGFSVCILSDVVFIGTPFDSDNGQDSGSVYMFGWNGSTWVQHQKLLAPDGTANDYFGYSVSALDDLVVIGAPRDDPNGHRSGSAYVFRRSSASGSWLLEQKLLAADGEMGDAFGESVGCSGDVVVVGAWSDDDNGQDSGSAYVFRRISSSWVQEAKLLPADGAERMEFGWPVAVSGDVVAVGAINDDDNGPGTGSVYVFRWNGSSWSEETKLLPSDGAGTLEFGWSVAVSGNLTIAGAPADDENGFATGAAYLFNLSCDQGYYRPLCLPCPGGAADMEIPDCRAPIPTVSGWGLVVLGLLTMVGGKLAFRKGRLSLHKSV